VYLYCSFLSDASFSNASKDFHVPPVSAEAKAPPCPLRIPAIPSSAMAVTSTSDQAPQATTLHAGEACTQTESRCMHVGLRPRLRSRPSLLDLIGQHSIERPSTPTPHYLADYVPEEASAEALVEKAVAVESAAEHNSGVAAEIPLPGSPKGSFKEALLAFEEPEQILEELIEDEEVSQGSDTEQSNTMAPVCPNPLFCCSLL
jgi:hypothetical protein